jgi:hypothetical protein
LAGEVLYPNYQAALGFAAVWQNPARLITHFNDLATWARQSSGAAVNLASPNTRQHSAKVRLVVMIKLGFS